jgi:branched-chain amino acid transport system permease protein
LIAGNMVAHWNADFLFVILASAATGGVTALVVGLPALRIRGLFLAVTTLAVAVALDQYFLNETTFPSWIPLNGVPRPVLLQRFNLNDNYTLYLVCLFFLALSILVTRGMRRSRAGRVLIATNDNERAAASVSVNTTAVRLAGFATAGVIAGIAGALDVYILSALSPGSFPPVDSITVFGYSVIGGLGSITGVLSGVLAFKYLESITAFGQFHLLISGTALLVVLQVIPGGFGQVLYDLRDRILRTIASRRGILVPTLLADRRAAGITAEPEPDLLTSIASGDVDGAAETGDDTAVLEVRS